MGTCVEAFGREQPAITAENLKKGMVLENGIGDCLRAHKVRWFRIRLPVKAKTHGYFQGDLDVVALVHGRLLVLECKNWHQGAYIRPSEYEKHIGSRFASRFKLATKMLIAAGLEETASLRALLAHNGVVSIFAATPNKAIDSLTSFLSYLAAQLSSYESPLGELMVTSLFCSGPIGCDNG